MQSSVKGLGELFAKNLKQLINQLFKEAQKESVVAQQTMESLAKDIQKERCVNADVCIAFRVTMEDGTRACARARAPALPAVMALDRLPQWPPGALRLIQPAPVSLPGGGVSPRHAQFAPAVASDCA